MPEDKDAPPRIDAVWVIGNKVIVVLIVKGERVSKEYTIDWFLRNL